MIARRFATVESVFGNLRGNKHLCRFSLRGPQKVDGQWKLDCLTHNIEKLAHRGYGVYGEDLRDLAWCEDLRFDDNEIAV